jgi:hypothetical protein
MSSDMFWFNCNFDATLVWYDTGINDRPLTEACADRLT